MVYNVQNAQEGTQVGKVSQSVINVFPHAKPAMVIQKNVYLASLDIMLIVKLVFSVIRDVYHAQVLHFALLVILILLTPILCKMEFVISNLNFLRHPPNHHLHLQ